jgi:hypothetical protein
MEEEIRFDKLEYGRVCNSLAEDLAEDFKNR